jgi:hypothetical protein
MKNFFFLSLIVVLTSCSRFTSPHYRNIRLVPAHGCTYSVTVNSEPSLQNIRSVVTKADNAVRCSVDTFNELHEVPVTVKGDSSAASLALSQIESESECVVPVRIPVADGSPYNAAMRNDWSVLIAVLFIFGGLCLLIWAVAILFLVPVVFWMRLLIGIAILPLAFRMIFRGVGILIMRTRQPKDYKESAH